MKRYTLVVVYCIIALIGCGKQLPDKSLVISAPTDSIQYQIPTNPVDKDVITPVPGHDTETIITVVTIPASSIPTTITVVENKKTFRQKVLPKKSEPEHKVGVISSNPEARAVFPERTPWWEYVAWIMGILTPVIVAIGILGDKIKWLAIPFSLLKKVFTLFRRKS